VGLVLVVEVPAMNSSRAQSLYDWDFANIIAESYPEDKEYGSGAMVFVMIIRAREDVLRAKREAKWNLNGGR
jgi:hypothetical protein